MIFLYFLFWKTVLLVLPIILYIVRRMFFTGKYEQLYLVAVMAEYIKQEMCDLNGTGEKPVYYRMKIQRNMDMEDFVERITYPGSGLSRGSVIQVMTTVAEHLAYCMAEGQSVTLDGIGTFTPRLGVAKDKEIDSLDGDEPKRNARSIEVNGINYRADKELVRETNLRCDLRRGGISRVWKSPFTEEERRTRALDYLHEHPFLRIQDYMAITGLKRSSANRELLRLSSDPASGLTISGYGSHRVYVRRKTEGDR